MGIEARKENQWEIPGKLKLNKNNSSIYQESMGFWAVSNDYSNVEQSMSMNYGKVRNTSMLSNVHAENGALIEPLYLRRSRLDVTASDTKTLKHLPKYL